jgi:xylan 1,4-beta-xylosidase
MVIAARSRSIHGPWENAPGNPLVRTQSSNEKWWSRGHATVFEGPNSTWWMIYHGYENSFWTLGRQTLLDPIEWTADGWFEARGGDLSRPWVKPTANGSGSHGQALSDDFSQNKFGIQWGFYDPGVFVTRSLTQFNAGQRSKAEDQSDNCQLRRGCDGL